MINPSPDLFNDFGNEEGKDNETHGEENLEGDKPIPIAAGPDLLKGAHEESEDKGSHDDAQSGTEKIIPEPDFC